jgi:hypothetical protein
MSRVLVDAGERNVTRRFRRALHGRFDLCRDVLASYVLISRVDQRGGVVILGRVVAELVG